MKKAKLSVERIITNDTKTSYYGNVVDKVNISHEKIFEFDKREDIAPCGLHAQIHINTKRKNYDDTDINEKEMFVIYISADYFDYEAENRFVTFFHIDNCTYEVCLFFGKDNSIEDVTLSVWEVNDFEDGDDADNIYSYKDFSKVTPFYS